MQRHTFFFSVLDEEIFLVAAGLVAATFFLSAALEVEALAEDLLICGFFAATFLGFSVFSSSSRSSLSAAAGFFSAVFLLVEGFVFYPP